MTEDLLHTPVTPELFALPQKNKLFLEQLSELLLTQAQLEPTETSNINIKQKDKNEENFPASTTT